VEISSRRDFLAKRHLMVTRHNLILFLTAGVVWTASCSDSPSPSSPDEVAAPAMSSPPPEPRAEYTVTFDATWSAATHPEDFPASPHFSGLIGATHNDDVRFWQIGRRASDGIKAMAERGSKTPLNEEIRAARSDGTANKLLSGDGIARSPGTVALDFEVRRDYPMVTLVSMVAPSPDWFAGVSALSLLDGNEWVDELEIELFAYDAGTDGGKTYAAADQPTSPREPIRQIEGRPLAVGGRVAPVGTFTFTKR
jgi:hypothetical protein